ncbi:hypothetical protein ElyMa_003090400 [Elysia marginata]|uniref:Uncharacterized protein n=1 Tax=Elysia marginata TaxID=1093978 RepID=A0AAV4IN52_9GAST|nr:hypothetical protein ElyMa_003090400 [Elysia marginata]
MFWKRLEVKCPYQDINECKPWCVSWPPFRHHIDIIEKAEPSRTGGDQPRVCVWRYLFLPQDCVRQAGGGRLPGTRPAGSLRPHAADGGTIKIQRLPPGHSKPLIGAHVARQLLRYDSPPEHSTASTKHRITQAPQAQLSADDRLVEQIDACLVIAFLHRL